MLGVSLYEIIMMKHKSTDWCSIDDGVPSDGENHVARFPAIYKYPVI